MFQHLMAMTDGKNPSERRRPVIENELDRLHASGLPVKIENGKLGWRCTIGILSCDGFKDWYSMVSWIRRKAVELYPQSQYAIDLQKWYEQRKKTTK
jgi:hypothetical protein